MSVRSIIRRSLLSGLLLAVVISVPVGAAVSRFLDVPDTNTFVADIEWLADTGVTKGCGRDVFCPDDYVTREQMAAFLHRLAENEVVAAASAIEAERAFEAEHAIAADSATEAEHAATADSATSASHAIAADSATKADHAATADSATSAGHAVVADSATEADHAATAASATAAADSALLTGRAPETYDTFVIGDARHAGDMGGQMVICVVEQSPFCPTSSAEGALVAEATFTTLAADSTVAVTGMTTLSSTDIPLVPTYVWLQLDSSVCFDSINAASTAAYTRQTLTENVQENVVVTIAFEIPDPGEHTVALCAQPFGGNASVLASTISGVVSGSPNSVTSQHFIAP